MASWLEQVLARLFWALVGLLFAVFRLLYREEVPGGRIGAVRDPLLLLSATQLAKKIRRREVCARPGEVGVVVVGGSGGEHA